MMIGATSFAKQSPPNEEGLSLRPGRWEVAAVVLILIVGIGFRLLYLGELKGMPELEYPPVDEGFNLYWATGLATGDWSLPPDAWGRDPGIRTTSYLRPPGYAFVLAGILHLASGNALGLRAIQMGLGLISVVLAWWVGRRLLGPAVGVVWAALMVLTWPLLYFQGGLNDAWLLVLSLLVLAAVLRRLAERPHWRWAGAAGVVFGLMALVRPNVLLFAPVLLIWGWWVVRRHGLTSRFWPMAGAAALAGMVVLAPATVRNWRVEGTFVPVSANGGLTLFHGNNDDAAGSMTNSAGGIGMVSSPWMFPDIVARVERDEGRQLTFSEASRILGRRAFAWMADHPGRELVLIGRRTALFWGPDEIAHNHVVGADRLRSPLLRRMPIGFSTALAGALVGSAVLLVWWRRVGSPTPLKDPGTLETLVALGLFVLVWFVSFLPFFATSLYRTPILPVLLLGAAVTMVEIGRGLRYRRRNALGWLAALVVALGLTHIPVVSADLGMDRWHYDRGLVWIHEGRPDRAEKCFREALEENSDHHGAHNGLGKIFLERNDPEGALRHFTRAAVLMPGDAMAHANRGLALARMGRWFEAEEAFVEAAALAPTNADSISNAGICRERLGDRRGAVSAYEKVLVIEPDHRSAANNLAWLLATAPESDLRDGDKAVILAERVVEQGAGPSTLDTLAAALAEAGRFDEAIVAAERALAVIPESAPARLAADIMARKMMYIENRPFRRPVVTQPAGQGERDGQTGGDDAADTR